MQPQSNFLAECGPMGQPLFGAAGQIRLHFFSLTTRSESFRAGRSGKEIMVFASVCTGSCRPPVWPADMIRICPYNAKKQPSQWDDCLFGAAGQIRTATAHSAYALCAVMPFPLALLAQLEVGSSISRHMQKSGRPDGATAFLELLGRFELPTSSLPRMRSTY